MYTHSWFGSCGELALCLTGTSSVFFFKWCRMDLWLCSDTAMQVIWMVWDLFVVVYLLYLLPISCQEYSNKGRLDCLYQQCCDKSEKNRWKESSSISVSSALISTRVFHDVDTYVNKKKRFGYRSLHVFGLTSMSLNYRPLQFARIIRVHTVVLKKKYYVSIPAPLAFC
jgi:hypothetical protein